MNELSKIKFSEICELYDGPHATPKPSEEGPIFLGIKSITVDGKIDKTSIRHISWSEYPKWTKRVTPQKGDVVFSYEATLHRYYIIPEGFVGCLGRRMALLRVKSPRISNIFLYYYLQSAKWKEYIEQKIIHGSTVDRLSIKDFPDYHIELPKRFVQNKIVSVLSAYDDLIENNNYRISILEEMVQKLYREWFVHFCFPEHENVQVIESEIGIIPVGWEVKRIDEVCNTYLGGTPSRAKAEYWKFGTIPWINSGKVNEKRIVEASEYITELGLLKSSTKKLPKRTTVIAITGATLGQVSMTEIEVCANQSVVGIIDLNRKHQEYIYQCVLNNIEEIVKSAGGGAQQHINKEIVNEFKILLPPHTVLKQYKNIVKPLFDEVAVLMFKNIKLQKQRDLLLSRLISGDIDVSNLDIQIKEE